MPPELIVAILIGVALTLYTVLGGADFGAGVWEFNTVLQSSRKERELIYRAIGPVWEANHVWMIFVLMLLANGFPVALAAISRALWLPLLLALVGIVFRGAAYAFRSHEVDGNSHRNLWGAVFAAASTAAPFFLGACVGALLSGDLQISEDGTYSGNHVSGWISSVSIFTAFYAVGACSYLAATYLAREAEQAGELELVEVWRRRALSNGLWMGILSVAGLALVSVESPKLTQGFLQQSLPLVATALLTGFISLVAMGWRRYLFAMAGVIVTVSAVLWGGFIAQYPLIVPPAIAVTHHAPENVLWFMVGGTCVGGIILLPSLVFLFMLFKSNSLWRQP